MHSQKVQGGPGEASSSSHTAPGHGSDSEPPSGSAAAERTLPCVSRSVSCSAFGVVMLMLFSGSDEVCRPPSSRTPSEEDSAQHAAAGPEAEENLEEKVER